MLRQGDCALVMIWPDPPRGAWARQVRRLQVAAEAGNSLAVLCYAGRPAGLPSAMRLKVGYCDGGMRVEVLKSRSSGRPSSVVLPLPEPGKPES